MRRTTALVLLGLGLLAPSAQAASDPLGSGTTKLLLDKGFLAFLKKDKVALSATAPARLKAGTLTLPVSGGLIDPTTGKGTIEGEGVLVFKGSRKKVPFKNLTLKTKRSPLIAKVGGSQLKVATSAKLAFKREGFGSSFSAKKLALSAKVAERLNKKLRPKVPFEEGQPIGSLISKTQPQTTTILERNRATLLFDSAFLAKLSARFVSVNPIFPAEHQGASFSFPIIIGGAIAPDASEGTLRTGGDVELLQLGGGQIFWHELWLDFGARALSAEPTVQPSPPFPGKEGRVGALGIEMAVASVSSDPAARTVGVSGALLSLSGQSAQAFNEAFAEGKPVFAAGERFGTLSFTAQGQ